jgi:hypothetical protein
MLIRAKGAAAGAMAAPDAGLALENALPAIVKPELW